MPLVIRAIRLDQVDDVKLVTCVFLGVGNFEIEPLGVRGSLVIVLKNQIVRIGLPYLNDAT